MNFALSIRKYTVHLPLYLTQLSLLLRAVNKVCLQLSVKDSVGSNIMVGELYIFLYLEQNSPLRNTSQSEINDFLISCQTFGYESNWSVVPIHYEIMSYQMKEN